MCDDVTDDVCQGCLLIALPRKTGPNIDDGESTWSCEVRYRGGRVRTVALGRRHQPWMQECRLACWRAGWAFIHNRLKAYGAGNFLDARGKPARAFEDVTQERESH